MLISLLTDKSRGYLLALMTIAFSLLVIGLIIEWKTRKNKRVLTCYGLLLSILFLNGSAFLELERYYRPNYDFELSAIGLFFHDIPTLFSTLFSLFCIGFMVFSMVQVYRYHRQSLNHLSIKDAIENLPEGLLFMSSQGELYLSNRVIHKVVKKLTNKELFNGLALWQEIVDLSDRDLCVFGGESPAFALPGGTVWQFFKNRYTMDGAPYYQIKAMNITEFYQLSKTIEKTNEMLRAQQDKLKKMQETMAEKIEEEVALDTKIKFHDDFGSLLTLTKTELEGSSTDYQDLWSDFSRVIDPISHHQIAHRLTMESIKDLSKRLSCTLHIDGNLPKEKRKEQLNLLAINEMMKNAVYHGKVKDLFITITEHENGFITTIKNHNNNHQNHIKEGGGLSGLRQKVESYGGTMELTGGRDVILTIRLPKE